MRGKEATRQSAPGGLSREEWEHTPPLSYPCRREAMMKLIRVPSGKISLEAGGEDTTSNVMRTLQQKVEVPLEQ